MNGDAAPVRNASGSLTESKGNATYTAPNALPTINPEAITAELWTYNKANQYVTYYLTSNVTVQAYDQFVTLVIDGDSTTYYQFEVNPDPNDATTVSCGISDGKLTILGQRVVNSNLFSSLAFEYDAPSIGSRSLVGYNQSGNDEIAFIHGQNIIYELNCVERVYNTATLICDETPHGGNISVTITQYKGINSDVVGTISGILYEDPVGASNNYLMPSTYQVEGSFRLLVVY